MEENYKLSHLRELEAESIHIIREVAAEFENPVMQMCIRDRLWLPLIILRMVKRFFL